MSSKISNLHIENFRGITDFQLILGPQIETQNIVILGENGTGKSSIIDALEFYFSGGVEKLQGRQDVKEKECIPNLNGGTPQITVELTTYSGYSTAIYPNRTLTFIPYDEDQKEETYERNQVPITLLDKFFYEASSRPFILRRAQLLDFINARGATRYGQISQLIGLGELDEIQTAWRQTLNELKRDRDGVKTTLQNIERQMQDLLGSKVSSEAEIIDAVNAKLDSFGLKPITSRSQLKQQQDEVGKQAIDKENLDKAQHLNGLVAQIQKIRQQFQTVITDYQELHQKHQNFINSAKHVADAPFETLLNEANVLIRNKVLFEACPLCQQDITDQKRFQKQLAERIGNLAKLTRSRQQVETQGQKVRQTLQILAGEVDTLPQNLQPYISVEQSSMISETEKIVKQWQQILTDDQQWPLSSPADWTKMIAKRQTDLEQLEQNLSKQSQSLTPSKIEQTLLERVELLARVDENWQGWLAADAKLRQAEEAYRQVELVYNGLVTAKRQGLDTIIKQVEDTFKDFYEKLHPDEGYGAITLPLAKSEASTSVGLKTEFLADKNEHPLGYCSEGHLDSLGLCIFLAFIKHFNRHVKLIILDDVLTSVDAGHRMRMARLLAQEFKDYQLFITTHDEMWAQQLTTVMKNADIIPKMVRLKPWTLAEGVDWDEYSGSNWSYYQLQICEGHRQDAIAGAGRALEKFLFQMRRNLRLAVPATPDDRYTIGDLYGPFFSWLEKHPLSRPDMPDYMEGLQQLKQELDDYWRFRNWSGAHYSEWGCQVSDTEALAFINIVKGLVQLFECPHCGELVVFNHIVEVVHCPLCKSKPQPKVIWQFRPDWKTGPERLLSDQVKNPELFRQQAIRATQSAFEKFLRDARFRLGFPCCTTPDDTYHVEHLYAPFFDWAIDHPCSDVDVWVNLAQYQAALDQYLDRGQWVDVADIAPEAETFVEVVDQVIKMFQCEAGHLLNYDTSINSYVCAACTTAEPEPGMPAHWHIVKQN